jgi:alpha-galactosidase
MTDRELLKQAMEALVMAQYKLARYGEVHGFDWTYSDRLLAEYEDARAYLNAVHAAIAEALKEETQEVFTREQMLAEVERRVERALVAKHAIAEAMKDTPDAP